MGQRIRVLVADDEADIRVTLTELLDALDMDSVTVGSGREVLELCDGACPFDIVLADVVMDDFGGLQLAAVMRALHPRIPVVLMTGREGMVDYTMDAGELTLIKPFTGEKLKRILDDALENSLAASNPR